MLKKLLKNNIFLKKKHEKNRIIALFGLKQYSKTVLLSKNRNINKLIFSFLSTNFATRLELKIAIPEEKTTVN